MNDAQRLSQDPTFRLIGSEKIWERGAALTSRLQTIETAMLAEEENFAGLAWINRELVGGVGCVAKIALKIAPIGSQMGFLIIQTQACCTAE